MERVPGHNDLKLDVLNILLSAMCTEEKSVLLHSRIKST